MEVKQCTDRVSVKNRLIITNILVMSFLLHKGFCSAAHARSGQRAGPKGAAVTAHF